MAANTKGAVRSVTKGSSAAPIMSTGAGELRCIHKVRLRSPGNGPFPRAASVNATEVTTRRDGAGQMTRALVVEAGSSSIARMTSFLGAPWPTATDRHSGA